MSTTTLPKPFTAAETSRAMFWWLVVVAAFACSMILVGGATRLTDSGLSIVEWRPVTGAIPPLTEQGWEQELEKYRQIPEYQLQNRGMSMAEFQFIYWWEWGHRQLGRVLGLVFAIPFFGFLLTGRMPNRLQPRLWVLFALGGLQGAIGWWMVSSGLTERLDVSQYRLATHLSMAFIILGLTLWTALELRYGQLKSAVKSSLSPWVALFWSGVFVQIALGAFVAGLDAGRIYTTWPGFNGQLFPPDYLQGMPIWQAIFESRPAVQFQHRWFAYALVVAGAVLAWKIWQSRDASFKRFAIAIPATLTIQVILGIATLMAVAPLWLSLLHQGGAIVLFMTVGMAAWTARRVGVAQPVPSPDTKTALDTTSRASSLTEPSSRS